MTRPELWLDDLTWLLFSPELLWSPSTAPLVWTPPQREAAAAWLDGHRVAHTPSPAPQASSSPRGSSRFMLGRYAEQLLAFYFTHGPTHRLHAAGLQVCDAHGRVQGELDFVIEDRATGELQHVELATKFFLQVGEQLIGPNAKEVMDAKVARLFRHQVALRLPEAYATASRRVMTRGVIYYRDGGSPPDLDASRARALHADHTRARWVFAAELAPRASAWCVLSKDAWMRTRHDPERASSLAGEPFTRGAIAELRRALEDAPSCLLAFVERRDGLWHEVERVTVVGPRFPARAE